MSAPIGLDPWVSKVGQFQQSYLVNRAALELFGHDVPLIGLAKNNTERKERLFRQTMIMTFVMLLAPLHAKLFAHEASRFLLSPAARQSVTSLGIRPSQLLQLSYKDCHSVESLQKGMSQLFRETFKKPLPKALESSLNEAFRQKMVRSKTTFLMLDLSTQGLFLTTIGYIKNLFAKWFLTGHDKFSGEVGLVSDEKLNKIYQQERQKQSPVSRFKTVFAAALGALVPTTLALMLRHALLNPKSAGPLFQTLKRHSHQFDYGFLKNIPIVSMVPFAVVGFLNDIGDILNSRSPREALENTIKISLSAIFLFGDLVWISLLGKTLIRNNPVPVRHRTSIRETVNWLVKFGKDRHNKPLSVKKIQGLAKQSAWLYFTGFVLNTLSVAGIVWFMNESTRQKIKTAARKVDEPGSVQRPTGPVTANIPRRLPQAI